MFEEIRKNIDRLEKMYYADNYPNEEDSEFIDNFELYFAKALKNELPGSTKIGKLLCIMDSVDIIKVKVE